MLSFDIPIYKYYPSHVGWPAKTYIKKILMELEDKAHHVV